MPQLDASLISLKYRVADCEIAIIFHWQIFYEKMVLFTPHINVSRSSHVSPCQYNQIQHVANYAQYYLRLRKIRMILYNLI